MRKLDARCLHEVGLFLGAAEADRLGRPRRRPGRVAWVRAGSNISCRELGRRRRGQALGLGRCSLVGWGRGRYSNGSQNWPASFNGQGYALVAHTELKETKNGEKRRRFQTGARFGGAEVIRGKSSWARAEKHAWHGGSARRERRRPASVQQEQGLGGSGSRHRKTSQGFEGIRPGSCAGPLLAARFHMVCIVESGNEGRDWPPS